MGILKHLRGSARASGSMKNIIMFIMGLVIIALLIAFKEELINGMELIFGELTCTFSSFEGLERVVRQ